MKFEHRIEIIIKTLSGNLETLTITVAADSAELCVTEFARALRRELEDSVIVAPTMSIEHIRDYPVKNENE